MRPLCSDKGTSTGRGTGSAFQNFRSPQAPSGIHPLKECTGALGLSLVVRRRKSKLLPHADLFATARALDIVIRDFCSRLSQDVSSEKGEKEKKKKPGTGAVIRTYSSANISPCGGAKSHLN